MSAVVTKKKIATWEEEEEEEEQEKEDRKPTKKEPPRTMADRKKPINGDDAEQKKDTIKEEEEEEEEEDPNSAQEDNKQEDNEESDYSDSPRGNSEEEEDYEKVMKVEKKGGEEEENEEEEKHEEENDEQEEEDENDEMIETVTKGNATKSSLPTATTAPTGSQPANDGATSEKQMASARPSLGVATSAAAAAASSEDNGEESSTWKPQVLASDFTPSPAHVLCGRRKGHKDFGGNWPGNLALEEVIAEHLDQYEAADAEEKKEITLKILAQVRRCNGGFVRISLLVDDDKKAQQRWMDVGDINARKDVAAIFRLFTQARRYQKSPKQVQGEGALVNSHQDAATQPILQQEQKPPSPDTPQMSFAQFQNAAKAHANQHETKAKPPFSLPTTLHAVSSGQNKPPVTLPTKLYAVENSSEEGQNRASIPRKRTTAAMENSLGVNNASASGPAGLAMGASRTFPTSIPGVPAPPTQFERPKKRRSVDESLAIDALQLIAKSPSTVDDVSTTNSTPTVRRRSGINMARPRASVTMEPQTSRKNYVRVCCLQLGQRRRSETPWNAAQRALSCLTSVAQNEQDIDLFILPELSPFGSSQDTFTKYLPLSKEWQHLYERVDEAFAEHARLLGVYIVYGTIGWHVRDTDRSLRFKLSHKVVDRQGTIVAVHDKVYLSDLEFRFFDAGHRKTVTFHIDGFTFGLLVGDDLKYPNLARGLARDNDVDVIVHPSADPIPLYFRQCRAVENSIYVLGVEYSTGTTVACPPDPDHDPVSLEPQDEDGEEGYLTTRIQRTALEYARTSFSHYRHMKTEISHGH